MNKEYIQLSETDYLVSSNNGNFEFINAIDNSIFEELLIKENELETKTKKFNDFCEELSILKIYKRVREFMYLFQFLFSILWLLIIKWHIIIDLSFVILTNVGLCIFCNYFLGKYKDIKNDIKNIENSKPDFERDIMLLEKKVKKMKNDINYKKYNIKSVSKKSCNSYDITVLHNQNNYAVVVNNDKKRELVKKKILKKQ